VAVAGKTGTAEIGVSCTPERSAQKLCDLDDTTDTDAWFVGYATRRGCPSRAAVGVVLMGGGAGGDTAAPAARDLLRAAIGRHDGLDPQGGSARRRATDGCAAPWAPDPSP
jgi:cell division protein FtsI/penicillin-binding protein 2